MHQMPPLGSIPSTALKHQGQGGEKDHGYFTKVEFMQASVFSGGLVSSGKNGLQGQQRKQSHQPVTPVAINCGTATGIWLSTHAAPLLYFVGGTEGDGRDHMPKYKRGRQGPLTGKASGQELGARGWLF